MIKLTRLNDTEIIVNENFIQVIDETPDTVITMQNGHRFSVRQTIPEIMEAAYAAQSGCVLVLVNRLNGTTAALNLNFIEIAEEVPDTSISLKNSHRYTVKESIDEVLAAADRFKQGIF